MHDDLSAFIIAAFALTGSPGPATLALAAAGAAFGMRRSLGLSLGIIAGVLAVLMLAAAGLTGVILAQPVIGPAVKIAAAAYMVYLAWRIASAPPLAHAGAGRAPTFFGGIFLGVGNPKAYAAMAALFSGFILSADRTTDLMSKALLLVVIIAIGNLAWILSGAMLARAMGHPVLNRAINVAFATALLASLAIGFVPH